VEDDLAQGVTFTALDVTASKQAEQERLDHEASQRDALVREVHHRIKNNLQGVIGLLRQHITENPGIQPVLESAIAQVNTVAVIHGLQSRLPQQELQLRELLLEVSNAAAAMALVPHSPTIQDTQPDDVWLDSGATVTIALILNELIHNAFKHGRHADGTGVTITLSGDDKLTTVHISNPGDSWPGSLNLTTGTGCGTGLDLIRTLLPRHGAQLNLYEDGVMLHVELVLSAPVIHASGRAEQT
jgi:two-component sensor histidine kinase